jgi:pantothenate kinase
MIMDGNTKSSTSEWLKSEVFSCKIALYQRYDYRDGYHYSLEHLGSFPDADDKIYRRGAPDTFDPASLARDLARIAHGREDVVHIPGFDHALGDPVTDQHRFERNLHKVVICEGLVSESF